MLRNNFGSLQELTVSDFFVEINPEWNRKETKTKRISSKRDSNDRGDPGTNNRGTVSPKKIASGHFLKRPTIFSSVRKTRVEQAPACGPIPCCFSGKPGIFIYPPVSQEGVGDIILKPIFKRLARSAFGDAKILLSSFIYFLSFYLEIIRD